MWRAKDNQIVDKYPGKENLWKPDLSQPFDWVELATGGPIEYEEVDLPTENKP
jgi:hypothetical protein